MAMQITIGDMGAIAGVLIYRPSFSGHKFRKPHIITIGYITFAVLVTSYLWWAMSQENKRRDEIQAIRGGNKLASDDSLEESEEDRIRIGDRHVAYRYQI